MTQFACISKLQNISDFIDKSTKIRSKFFDARFVINPSLTEKTCAYFAIVAPKKFVSRLATERNKAKRRVRCAIKQSLKKLELPENFSKDLSFTFFLRKNAIDCPYTELLMVIDDSLQKMLSASQKREN